MQGRKYRTTAHPRPYTFGPGLSGVVIITSLGRPVLTSQYLSDDEVSKQERDFLRFMISEGPCASGGLGALKRACEGKRNDNESQSTSTVMAFASVRRL